MKRVWKHVIAILLTIVLLFSVIPLETIMVSANGNTTLTALQSKYPHGKYWNGGDPNTYTSTPCTHHGSCIVTGGCYCNCFKGHAIQCVGFAYQLASLVYGGDPWAEWTKNTNQSALNSLKAGDVVCYKNKGHSIFVTAVNGDTVTYADCNSDEHCIIRWNQTISKSTLKSTFSYVDPAPYAWDGGNTHTHSYTTYLHEAEHPHRISVRCSDYSTCGGWKWTNQYQSVKTCQQCWYFKTSPDKTSVTISTNASTEVNLNTSMFCPDSAMMRVDYDSSIIDATISSGVVKFTGKKTGSTNYKISVYSDSSKSYLIDSCTIKVIVTNNYNVSFDKSSVNLARPSKTTDAVTVTLSGNWPDNAGYIFEYDDKIVSYTQDVATFTLKAKKAGTTNFKIKIVDRDDNSIVYDYDTCIIRVSDDTYTIKYNANGGTGAPASQTKTYNKTLTLSSTKPTRAGYTFLGWSTSSNATSSTYQPGGSFNIESNKTLYAVWAKIAVRKIEIQFEPNKTEYYIGDSLDTTGLQLKVVYSDSSEKYITSGFTTSGFTSTSAGTKTVTVAYEHFNDTFFVTVKAPTISLSSTSKTMEVGNISILTATTTPLGQSVTWTSSNTRVATVSNGTITAKATGATTITASFTYKGYTYSKTCNVTVKAPKTLESISVHTKPTKTSYYIGDSLNTSGLKIKLTYSDGTTSTLLSGFTTSGFSSTSAGTKSVTVTYEGFTDTFTVTINTPSITLSPASKTIDIGDTVTLTVATTPSDQTISWTSNNTNVVTVSDGTIKAKSDGIAAITAKFTYNGYTYSKSCYITVEKEDTLPYIDVTKSDPNYSWFNEGIKSMYQKNIMTGLDATHFGPYGQITRADFALTLYRIAGKPTVSSMNLFSDVSNSAYYTDAVVWASENGIVKGMGDGTFKPDAKISRQDMVVMMYRYSDSPSNLASGNLSTFKDVADVFDYAQDALKWAISQNLVKGNADGGLAPQKSITRAEIAVILERYLDN